MRNFRKKLAYLHHRLPHFPDGRIDYRDADEAVVVTCFVRYQRKFLFLKRSDQVRMYQGKWHTVAGYLDELISPRQKVIEELQEEIGINKNSIERIVKGKPFVFVDDVLQKTWHISPFLVDLKKTPQIQLDHEHTEFKWVSPDEIGHFDTVPSLLESLRRIQ